MSYILDALKKSDQERQQGAGPSLQTIHRPHANAVDRRWLYVLLVLLVALLLAVGIGGSWFWFKLNSPNEERANAQQSLPEKPVAAAPVTAVPVNSQPSSAVSLQSSTDSALPKESLPKDVSAQQVEQQVVVPFSELPLNVRNAIPAMTFSFHVYSSNPARRTIIINGRRVKQGAAIDNGLLLEEITSNGVIFRWQEHHFSIPVVEDW